MTSESKCPVAGGGEREGKYAEKSDAMRAFANSDWWPEQLNLKGLQHDSPLVDPMGEEFDYAKEFESLDLNAVINDLQGFDDRLAGLVAGGLRPLRAAVHPDGVAQRGHLSHPRRPRRRRIRSAALCAAQQLAGQREPRQGAAPVVADQAEIRPQDLMGRPPDPDRQRGSRIDGLQDVRLRLADAQTAGSPTIPSTGVRKASGWRTSAISATASCRIPSARCRWASSTSIQKGRTASRIRSRRRATFAKRSSAWR